MFYKTSFFAFLFVASDFLCMCLKIKAWHVMNSQDILRSKMDLNIENLTFLSKPVEFVPVDVCPVLHVCRCNPQKILWANCAELSSCSKEDIDSALHVLWSFRVCKTSTCETHLLYAYTGWNQEPPTKEHMCSYASRWSVIQMLKYVLTCWGIKADVLHSIQHDDYWPGSSSSILSRQSEHTAKLIIS